MKDVATEEEVQDLEKGIGESLHVGEGWRKAAKEQVDPPTSTATPSSGGMQTQAPACNQRGAGALTLGCLLCKHPHLLVAPLVIFCIIAALSAFGIMRATTASYNSEANHAREAAVSAADGIATQLSSASRAALSLAAVVRMNPSWAFLESNFEVLAKELFRQSNEEGNLVLRELALIPFGRVTANYGTIHHGHHSSIDLFSSERIESTGPYRSLAQRGLTVNGPIPFKGTEEKAFAARYPVFFNGTDEDESWGHPDNITHPTGCPGPPCYNPATREKFWGFIGGVVSAEPLLRGDIVHLKRLLADDLSYSLTTSFLAGTGGPGTLVSGGPNPEKVTANVSVDLPGTSWKLSVYNPRLDEIVELRKGLLAMVVIAASVLSALLLLLLLSFKRASVYLQEQLVTNKLLQEEKVSREALLGRQLDLLSCFEHTTTKRIRNLSRSKLSAGQLKTLDQISTARAAISDVRRSEGDHDVIIKELLAEGSFGKVYRGKWRGTDVAVKIIMLPANMSGREKREKMVVWEAAISSSLIHPNVQLVLEYCDRSSLRDALDAGLFMTPRGMNYAALLDCAMDVAKAMLHLHCNNVLHLDLKTRNILLASSGTGGKGVTCKAAVAQLECRLQFGIVLWELFTRGYPFRDVPPALLGHLIVREGKRPSWPSSVPKSYRDLANACWDQNPDARPRFEVILEELTKMRTRLGIPTPPLQPTSVQPSRPTPMPWLQRKLPQLHEDRAFLEGLEASSPQLQGARTFSQAASPQLQDGRTFSQASSPLLPSRDSRNFLQTKGPSTPSQAEFLQTRGLSPLSRAPEQSSTGDECLSTAHMSSHSMLDLLATSALQTPQTRWSLGSGACAVSPLYDSRATAPCTSNDHPGSNSLSTDGCHAVSPFRFSGISHSMPIVGPRGVQEVSPAGKQFSKKAVRLKSTPAGKQFGGGYREAGSGKAVQQESSWAVEIRPDVRQVVCKQTSQL
ncbi:hypothetical protein DUNSADRAFT_4860 [Dunaliella salina]|uniref:Protein kinase domain-containing protein n=1 Tax=Dunaliella salina TaxID=3046 RepID=A0ABQ7GR50_DUNSA|nr:hypothetical protein DUNSADRAFT_4860 [Dunaliella salina]|eukprot:KAF5837079.1 hypothetical protein DUNSADRAFT_4860 [Dunaliella salina]